MKIQVKQLGAIKEGTIDLSRKLNIFCGPNGTGKTYMAYVLYALAKLDNKTLGLSLDAQSKKAAFSSNEFQISIPSRNLFNFRKDEIYFVKQNLWLLFSIPEEKADQFFKDTEILCLETETEFVENHLSRVIKEHVLKIFNYIFYISKESGSESITIKISDQTTKNEDFLNLLDFTFVSKLCSVLAFWPITNSTIFPVERNSIYTFVKELSISRNEALDHIEALTKKDNIDRFKNFFKRSTRYPQPIRDCLRIAEDLENMQKQKSEYYDFAVEMEQQLLKGKVIITKEGNVAFASNKAAKEKLSFHQSSSIVKTLASLIIYLKHEAQYNDLVIIDEPELNLHPDNQVIIARLFSKLINKGLRLVISTHSDYIIREFNNLIMISNNRPEILSYAKSKNYAEDEFLSPSDVNAYVFNFKNKGAKQCIVTNQEITKYGFEIKSVDETIDQQNDIAEELSYLIKYGKGDS